MATGPGVENNGLHKLLTDANLLRYEQTLLDQGADDILQLRDLQEEEFQQLCLLAGMSKHFHVLRFRKALGRALHPANPSSIDSAMTATTQAVGYKPRLLPIVTSCQAPTFRVQSLGMAAVGNFPSHSTAVQLRLPASGASCAHTHFPHARKSHQLYQAANPQGERSTALTGTSQQEESGEKKIYLPSYLQPGSETKSFDDLVDDTTPVQKSLGPCPFSPSVWDERRADFIRRQAAIYGQHANKRKNEQLTGHEENVNEASYQLCLRDPTLLVRREELFVLARRAVKEGGYIFMHGYSRAKGGGDALTNSGRKRTRCDSDEEGSGDSKTTQPLKLREKRAGRLSELEDAIAKNKSEQAAKLAMLEQAQKSQDYATAYHVQSEIETLGSTCLKLQTEYSTVKKKERRSQRYYRDKDKKTSTPCSEPIPPAVLAIASSSFSPSSSSSSSSSSSPPPLQPQGYPSTANLAPMTSTAPTSHDPTLTLNNRAAAREFELLKASIYPTQHPSPRQLVPYYREVRPLVTAQVLQNRDSIAIQQTAAQEAVRSSHQQQQALAPPLLHMAGPSSHGGTVHRFSTLSRTMQ